MVYKIGLRIVQPYKIRQISCHVNISYTYIHTMGKNTNKTIQQTQNYPKFRLSSLATCTIDTPLQHLVIVTFIAACLASGNN